MSTDIDRDLHGRAEDHRNELYVLRRQEDHARERAHQRVIAPLVQEPHAFQTPIPRRYEPVPSGDHMLAPGSVDDTGFSTGIV